MLTFNFPTLTAEPIELEFNDFIPAEDYCVTGFPAFWFGTALVLLDSNKRSPCAVCLFSNYDEEEEEWQNIEHGTCTPETFDALCEYYDSNT